MAATRVKQVAYLNEMAQMFTREVIEEFIHEYGLEGKEDQVGGDVDELYDAAMNAKPINSALADRLIESGAFVKAEGEKISREVAEKISPDNPTEIKLNPSELEGLTKREQIRRCKAAGMETKDIHTYLGIRAQMVHNTLKALSQKDPSIASCKVCGRPLKDEESIRDGVGPVCAHRE